MKYNPEKSVHKYLFSIINICKYLYTANSLEMKGAPGSHGPVIF